MGNFAVQRDALVQAQEYMRDWDDYDAKVKNGDKDASRPSVTSSWTPSPTSCAANSWSRSTAIVLTSSSPRWPWPRSSATKFAPFTMRSRPTKWPRSLAAQNVGIATFADWWGYKQEAWDAIPWNAVLSMRKGVRVAIKSDSDDFARRLNQEAAKTMRYGGATEDEALKMITLNAAWIVGVDDKVGSIDVGKDADLVYWDGYPLSSSACPTRF